MSLQANTRPRPASNGVRRTLSFAMAYIIFPALLFVLFAILITPYFADAEEPCKSTAFCPLADVSGSLKLRELYNSDTDLVGYINSLFKVAISLGAIIAVIRLAIGGFMYMGGEMWRTKEAAKIIFKDVFLGLFLLLSIWIILSQINPQLLNLKIDFQKVPEAPTTSSYSKSSVLDIEKNAFAKILADEVRVRRELAGITIKDACREIYQKNCVNVGLLSNSAITGLQKLKAYCKCTPRVSGGTEFWGHASHGPNYPIVDLSKNNISQSDYTALNNYIKGFGIPSKDQKNRTIYTHGSGNSSGTGVAASFLDEDSDHWHVTFR